MIGSCNKRRTWQVALMGATLLSTCGLTGCHSDVGGQTLPSPYYMKDDVQYFPPGAQFKLSKEATAMRDREQQAAPKQE